jgi:GT2 family glycosyltransferase
LTSLLANTEYPNYELFVVDNGSSDGTPDDLRALAGRYPHVRVILNDHNRGFGPANNQALAVAGGDVLVLLNNDTMVPPGWLTRLVQHLAEPRLGLIGPATNRTCNEAQVAAPYATYGEFVRFARERAVLHDGQRAPIRMPMMFCTALRRDVYSRVGPLDEQYEVGMFEDEDYALRVKAAGYDLAWAPDVFVHHAYHASIGKLLPTGEYMALVRANQGRFEAKWGICWERHRPQPR